MILLAEQDLMSTERNYIETVIKQYQWGKTNAAPGRTAQMHREAEDEAAGTASQLKQSHFIDRQMPTTSK